ncbi:MAG TPA: hypothetical protein PKV17_13010 [Aquabacterium sp.]|nr:hypothetical protein [Aquabacterium sp.]
MSVPEDTFVPVPRGEAPAADTTAQTPPTDQVEVGEQAQSQQDDQSNDAVTDEQQQERDGKGRFKPGVQSRIDELTKARHEAEREAAYWKGRASTGEPKQEQAQTTAPEAANPKPTPDKFDDYGEYIEALTEWKADEKVSKALAEREVKAAAQQQAQTRASTWEQRQAAARTAFPDYDAVVGGSDATVAKHVAESMQDSEHGPALAYHLAKHPEVLAGLNGMSPRQADREIGRIEERLAAKASDAAGAEPPAAKTTQAPKPAAVTSSQGRSTTPDPSKMTMAEYEAFRSKGPNKARWAR